MVTGRISGIASVFPPALDQQDAWDGFFSSHFSNSRLAQRVWRTAGIEQRHTAVDPRVEDLSGASTAERMRLFAELALPLARDAVSKCLENSNLAATDVELLTVASCTGYLTPGLDILVARDLSMSPSVQRLHIGHMGCYAALPALSTLADAACARNKVGVMVCVELTSLHLQSATDDIEQIVAHALFSDAAAAAAIVPDGRGLEVVDIVARTDTSTADLMSWEVTDHGFRMRLSPKVPNVLDRHVLAMTTELLDAHHLTIADIDHWAIHPGGPKIVATVAQRLGLTDNQVTASTDTLRRHGNCSSATLLVVLEEIINRERPQQGQHIVAMAFGPGLTLYGALLRVR